MIKEVERILKKYNLVNKENVLLLGLSGGADSVCLSDIVHKLSVKYGFKLILCHLNHNWRGKASQEDMDFCIEFAQKRDLQIKTKTLSKDEKKTETNARELRYKFFEECKKEFKADAILLAHNKNDRVETLIYRIIKGTGTKGLSAIKEKRDNYIRPLITIARNQIEEYCTLNNLSYVTDSTNFENNYNRNYIRNEILPKFEKINEKYIDAIYNLSIISEEEEKYIEEQILKAEKEVYIENKIQTQKFLNLPEMIQNRLIMNIYLQNDIDYNAKRIYEILNFIKQNKNLQCGSKISLTKDIWLFVSEETIELVKKVEKQKIKINITKEGEYKISNYIFKIEKYNGEPPTTYPQDSEYKAYIELNEPIDFVLRNREEGDYIHPLGLKGTQKLKKYLNSKKIKSHEKENLIFLCKGKEVLWSPPYGLNDKIKVVTKPNYVISLNCRKEKEC